MTCEIAVANRLGIALAADSAVTFTKGGPNGTTTSYSSGANKILQPVRTEPIGLMVYNNSTFGNLPWELLVKQFRIDFDAKFEPLVSGYMSRLVEYLESAENLFPRGVRSFQTNGLYGVALIRLIATLKQRYPIATDEAADLAARTAACAEFIAATEHELDQETIAAGLLDDDFVSALANEALDLVTEAEAAVAQSAPDLSNVLPVPDLLRLAVKVTYKRPSEVFVNFPSSGIVIAGYGRDEVLPAFVEREFFGFIGTRVYSIERKSKAVPRNGVGAVIEAFARRAMVETFTQGISPEAWGQAEREYRSRSRQLIERSIGESGGTPLASDRVDTMVDESTDGFMSQWARASIDAHWHPLLEVVAGLAMDQLAELGENLVMLESLKERVTHRTQSVGGPIDVAVITKAEGLVWIKRKHFFPRELNHRYFGRLSD